MARRKNTNRIDPRYFLNETTIRDLEEEYKMGDPEMALTTAQAMAAQELGIDPRADLYVILFGAVQGNSPKHKKALQHPAFKDDPRVKKLGH